MSENTRTMSSRRWARRNWRRQEIVEEILLAVKEGDFSADLAIEWVWTNREFPIPRLRVYDGSWRGVEVVMPVLRQLDGQNASPETVIRELERIGFRESAA